MAHKCFISFKAEDIPYKNYIQNNLAVDMIDKSLEEPIDSDNEDYIMQCIRDEYLSDSSVTIHLIGLYGAEVRGWNEQRYIKRELQASLYNASGNSRSGILGVVLPDAHQGIYKGSYSCSTCGGSHNHVAIGDATTIKEFSYNYYIPNEKCSHTEEDRYCVLVSWADFRSAPNHYIDAAFDKRTALIASKVRVRPE